MKTWGSNSVAPVTSRLPSPFVAHVSQQTSPHWNLSINPLGLSLQGFPEMIPLPRPKRWVSRLGIILCLFREEVGIRDKEATPGESETLLETAPLLSLNRDGRGRQKILLPPHPLGMEW